MKKRVALLFHGVVGSENRWGDIIDYKRPLKTHIKNLYKNETCELDVFMHVWDYNNKVSDYQLELDFQPKIFSKIKPLPTGNFEDAWPVLYKSYWQWNGAYREKNNIIKILERINSQMFGLYYANELKRKHEIENNFKYDFVIKTRYDLLLGWKPDFNKLDSNKFYSLPYNKHDKVYKGEQKNTMTDFFWIAGSELMDKFCQIAPNFKSYILNSPEFVEYFAGKLEYGWVWHMINVGIYDSIELQDFLECPISLNRFLNEDCNFNQNIVNTQTGCLPFTGWKNKGLYTKEETHEKMMIIQKKLKSCMV